MRARHFRGVSVPPACSALLVSVALRRRYRGFVRGDLVREEREKDVGDDAGGREEEERGDGSSTDRLVLTLACRRVALLFLALLADWAPLKS